MTVLVKCLGPYIARNKVRYLMRVKENLKVYKNIAKEKTHNRNFNE
jgi:hypothetical protein